MDIPTGHFVFVTGASFFFGAIATLLIIRFFASGGGSGSGGGGPSKARKPTKQEMEDIIEIMKDDALASLQKVRYRLEHGENKDQDVLDDVHNLRGALYGLEYAKLRTGYNDNTKEKYSKESYERVSTLLRYLENVDSPYVMNNSELSEDLMGIKLILNRIKRYLGPDEK